MDETMFWFGNQLMTYFGDDGDDAAIIARLRVVFVGYPFVARVFQRGLDHVLTDPAWDRVGFVTHHANRSVRTDDEARAWLAALRDRLFGQ